MSTLKIARSFLLPVMLLVLIPWGIHRWFEALDFKDVFSSIAGIAFILTGLSFLAWTNVLFLVFGQGTPAPWDPAKKLVILGPYRYVRNPMMIAILTTLWGETLLFGSFYIFGYSLLLWLINHLYLIYVEEPGLEERYGLSYKRYKQLVPRWLPLGEPVKFDP